MDTNTNIDAAKIEAAAKKPKKPKKPQKPRTRRFHEVPTHCFGAWLRGQLQAIGKSEIWLARRATLNPNSIAGYVCGHHAPRITTLWRICVILGGDDCDDLFTSACDALRNDLRAMRYPDA